MTYPTAWFVKLPFQLEDLMKPRPTSEAQPYIVEKTMEVTVNSRSAVRETRQFNGVHPSEAR